MCYTQTKSMCYTKLQYLCYTYFWSKCYTRLWSSCYTYFETRCGSNRHVVKAWLAVAEADATIHHSSHRTVFLSYMQTGYIQWLPLCRVRYRYVVFHVVAGAVAVAVAAVFTIVAILAAAMVVTIAVTSTLELLLRKKLQSPP